jgi:ribosomal protein L30/L7E
MKKILAILALSLAFTGCQSVTDSLFVTEKEVQTNAQGQDVIVEVTKPAPIVEAAVKASGALPIPYLETGLSALLAGAGAYVGRLRKQRKTLEAVTASLVAGVESYAKSDEGQKTAKAIKGRIQEVSVYLGYDKELHDRVQKIVNSGKNA